MALQTIEFIPAVGDDHAIDLREGTERIWPSPAPAANDYYMVVPNYITVLNTLITDEVGDAVAYAPADSDGLSDGHQLALGVANTTTTLVITFTPSGGDAQTINVSVYRRPDVNTELIEEVSAIMNMVDEVNMTLTGRSLEAPESGGLIEGRLGLSVALDGLEAFKARGIPGERYNPIKEYYFTEYVLNMRTNAANAIARASVMVIIRNKFPHLMNLIPGIHLQAIADGRKSDVGVSYWAVNYKIATPIRDTVLVPEVDAG